jgi:hypothetical protein
LFKVTKVKGQSRDRTRCHNRIHLVDNSAGVREKQVSEARVKSAAYQPK